MKKALEALERIKKTIQQLDYGFVSKEDCEDFNIIETALKEYEKQHQIDIDVLGFAFKINTQIEKKLKALEIIKEKEVNLHWLKNSKDLEEYNECLPTHCTALTQKEYDLLKEVLM